VKDRHIFFKAGTSMLLCFLPEVTKAEQNLPPHFAYGKQHIAFEVSPEMYEKWQALIRRQKIKIIHYQHWKGDLYSFYFEDPNGHLLEIVPVGIWN
jgi:catechol 2,3-dioxygenase-like lactoylglutathione lyase family enzyme